LVTEPRRPKALVVDDFDGVREAVRLMLDALDYDAEGVASGAEALDRLARASYAVVITDLGMPDVSGWTLAEHVRQRRPDVKLVLMTGQFTSEVSRRARDFGVPVLEKPFSLRALQAAIEEARRT
jgi:two-component system, NarL family, capsular synthesis sensor histidine kinase RcsC